MKHVVKGSYDLWLSSQEIILSVAMLAAFTHLVTAMQGMVRFSLYYLLSYWLDGKDEVVFLQG